MKYVKSILMAVASVFFLFSCGGDSQTGSAGQQEADTQHQANVAGEEHQHDDVSEAIELNDGMKWKVNDEMKPFILRGEELVSGYLENTGNDYALLAKNIKEQNDQLIKSCTMEGKSHDELHKWLHPHLELVKELSETKDTDKAKELVGQLEKSYKKYGDYFQ